MIDPAASLLMLGRVLVSLVILFVLLPALAVRSESEEGGPLSRLFPYLLHANVFLILTVHVLVVLKLYETLSLLVAVGLAIGISLRMQAKSRLLAPGGKAFIYVMELADQREIWRSEWKRWMNVILGRTASGIQLIAHRFLERPVVWCCIAAVFLWAAGQRFSHAFSHMYFGAADAYIHLSWAKDLMENRIYVDGVYPQGFEAILSAISAFFVMDPYLIVRFMGPITGLLIIASLFYVLRANFKELLIPFIGILIYVAGASLPVNVWRQMSSLPMEYALIFLLPGIHDLNQFLLHGERKRLLLSGEALLAVVLIHPYTAACLGAAYVIVCLVHIRSSWRTILSLPFLSIMLGAGVLGLMPILIGLTAGLHFHSLSINYMLDNIQAPQKATGPGLLSFRETNAALAAALLCAFILLGNVFVRGLRNPPTGIGRKYSFSAGVTVITAVYYLLYRAKELHLPELLPADRAGVFLSLMVAAYIASLAGFLFSIEYLKPKTAVYWRWGITGAAAVLILISSSYKYAPGSKYQYDESIEALFAIKKQFHFPDWVMIAPMEEGIIARRYGYHTNLSEFVQSLQPGEKPITFKAHDVFLFIEKMPLGAGRSFTADDALRPFPQMEQADDATEFYYRNAVNRTILEAKAYAWAEAFRKKHPEMSVYYDGTDIRVYRISHPEENPKFSLK